MKVVLLILLTLFVINIAAKAAPFSCSDPIKNVRLAEGSKQKRNIVFSAPNHYKLNEGEYIILKRLKLIK